ncbi:midasin [Pisolithus albus]|nr:midasin [Pisolithus albus]
MIDKDEEQRWMRSPFVSSLSSSLTSTTTTKELLGVLSRCLAEPSLTNIVADLWLERGSDEEEEKKFIAMCLLIENHEELFPVLSTFLRQPHLDCGPLAFVEDDLLSIPVLDTTRLQRLLLAYYRLLRANRHLPSELFWPASALCSLFASETSHLDPAVRYLAIRCYALHTGMAEVERSKLEREVFGAEVEKGEGKFGVAYDPSGIGKEVVVDARVMPALEMKRIHEVRTAMMKPHDFYTLEEGDVSQRISESDLSPWLVNVHGVLMLKNSPTQIPPSQVVFTPSAICALRSLAMHVSLRLPTLISSPPSSGKSMFLTHLASMLYPNIKDQIVTVHLADTSLDPRSLLGSYVSSPTRLGMFEWKDGVVVRAMKEGKWLVFEDIDKGSMEVLGLIKPLVESIGPGKWIGGRARIEVPNRGKVYAAEGFAVFATRSVLLVSGSANTTKKMPGPTFYGASKFSEVVVDVPSVKEVRMIVSERYPEIVPTVRRAIVRMWMAIMGVGTTVSTVPIGLRELEKFFTRIRVDGEADEDERGAEEGITLPSLFPNLAVREEMYLEARDVFFGGGTLTGPARAHQERVASIVAEHLGLDEDRRKWVLQGFEKDVNGDTTGVLVGRARLLARANKATMLVTSPTRPFALHNPAKRLLSRIATAISFCEPILLTGETGTGKTSAVTHLATLLRRPLVSLNLSHQTESSDLLGGFKPVDARVPAGELSVRFMELFGATFSRKRNVKFEESVRKAVQEGKWKRAVVLWKEATRLAKERIERRVAEGVEEEADIGKMEGPRKRRKVDDGTLLASQAAWERFEREVDEFDMQHAQGQGKFAFDFVEGPLVRALRVGDWVLLDEINLASSETLECVTALLNGPTASITLTEKGSLEAVPRHPDFRLFACMNPATDVGKKDLPPNIRARFTEIDVPPPDADRETLLRIVHQYIGHCAVGDKAAIMDVAEFYAAVKKLVDERQLADGSDRRPHFSMRTLARALTFAADVAPSYGLRRALWEGCLMAFTMVLDGQSTTVVIGLAQKHILSGMRNPKSVLSMEPALPPSRPITDFVKFGPFYLERGPLPEDAMDDYIMTPSVEKKLIDLARIVLTRRFPVLIEGPTSSGKTSAVQFLARRTGHQFIRINNHEHTDIQEYIGSYASDPATGKLVFKDGLLVHALRHGHWIVLDELNLAPTEVLEALNRLLDDNRELVISETHEVVRPHPHFMLFATQNPPGLYAGRKVLSRAFRNRFLEVHFQDVPQAELEAILCQRCRIAPSYGQRIVRVFRELQQRRQVGRIFESKQGFATLRDLFRWAGRDAVGYQELAENGYMLLAERARREEDKLVVKEVIESVMKVRIDETALYDLHQSKEFEAYIGCPVPSSSQIIWTYTMRRLFVLVARALRFNEPVLLVGETGSGKTSVCQLYAEVTSRCLHTLSCHQNTETCGRDCRFSLDPRTFQHAVALLGCAGLVEVPSDVQGLLAKVDETLKVNTEDSLRTSLLELRSTLAESQALFQWHDGPLLRAMREGEVFLLDEISLADDSVLERLNSVLEPERTIVLAERGGMGSEYPAIHATETFKLLATMNPGGDYGKKELSPALRNRFTEIWVPPVDSSQDLAIIVNSSWRHEKLKPFTAPLLAFCHWLRARLDNNYYLYPTGYSGERELRLLSWAWVAFSNAVFTRLEGSMHVNEIFHHAAYMTFLDAYSPEALQNLRNESASKLDELVPRMENPTITYDPSLYTQFGQFAIPRGPEAISLDRFNLNAPTTRENVMRVARACQLEKPILLEGSPGVGKTSLVTALAKLAGYRLCRINLSDQTDLIDLFGSDIPAESGAPGEFMWKDAEFLRAMQEGHWVLLDEMNLAPQTVLEGLNAILDHRGTVFVPELGRTFVRHPSFRVFAAQNPLHQGGGRKGLPRSFLDRFTKVYVEELTAEDLLIICRQQFSGFDDQLLQGMIAFNTLLNRAVVQQRLFGREGSPWEFNLRDIMRWGELLRASGISGHPRHFLRTIYLSRFRDLEDRRKAQTIFNQVFPTPASELLDAYIPPPVISSSHVQIGHFSASRGNVVQPFRPTDFLQVHSAALETIWACVARSWPVIVTGPHDIGKTSLIRTLADLSGNHLDEIGVTSATDTSDILGGFEQVDQFAQMDSIVTQILELTGDVVRSVPGVKHRYPGQVTLRREMSSSLKTRTTVLQAASQLLVELSMLESNDPDFKSRWQHLHLAVLELSQMEASAGRFEWVDGPLIQAMKKGHWLVLDAANTCNPSVLDRLNSLCEPNGVLVLTERGLSYGEVEILKPHPNFRLFMTVDPQYGELSRAMRNRGLEVSLDQDRVSAYYRHPNGVVSSQVDFEGRRRGIILNQGDKPSSAIASTNMSNDTISSMLTTLAPIITADDGFPLSAIVPFVMRAFSRSVLPLLRHLLRTIPPASAVLTIFEDRFLLDTTTALTRLWKEPISGIAQQLMDVLPLDDFMVCAPCSRCMEHQPAHHLRLQILDFFAALVIDKFERDGQITPASSRLPTIVTESIQAILVEVQAASRTLYESFIYGTGNYQIEDLSISVKLLGLSRRLRRVLTGNVFDYSTAQVLAKSIATALENHSRTYDRVASASTIFLTAVSPSSGLGLMMIELGPLAIRQLEYDLQIRGHEGLKSKSDHVADLSTLSKEPAASLREHFQTLALATLPSSLVQGFECMNLSSQIKNVALENHDDLRRFVPYQHVIWALENAVERVSLSSLEQHEVSIQQHLQSVAQQCYTCRSRFQQLTTVFNQSLAILASSFSSFFGEHELQLLRRCRSGFSLDDAKTLLATLGSVPFKPLREAIQHLVPALTTDIASASLTVTIAHLGRCWIALSRITLHGRLERRTAGNETNLAQESTALLQLRTGIPDRNDLSRLSFFWTEVSQFVKQVIQYSRIDDLLASLESNSATAFSREDVVQESISKFVLRLTGLYPEYNDIVQILRLALSQLRLGLRLARHACGSAGTHAPSVVGSGITRAERLLITVAAAADYRRSGDLVPPAEVVFRTYEQAFRLWTIDRTRDEKREQDFGSLYRGGTSSHGGDEEAEMEREFLELFPMFEDVPLDEDSSASGAKGHCLQLLVLHLQLMDVDDAHPALRSYLETNLISCSDLLDRDTLHLQVSLLQEHLALVRDSCATRTKTSNFYARKALAVVRSLQWPDQVILQHLLARCDVVLALDLNSPNLLLQTEDWEILTDDRQAITNLIVEWRRLELSSWRSLLDSQCQLFVDATAEEDSRNLSEYLQRMPYLLDDFMRTSSLGQFHARLKLLKSFEILIGPVLSSVMRIVHFSWRFFHLYSSQLSQSLGDQRRSLEKEVDALIKLASWKDVNVQALKQSARKTHHQLYKIIRKFRDALRQPVAQKLSSLFTESMEGARQPELPTCHRIHGHPFSRPCLPSTTVITPPSSGNLGRTLANRQPMTSNSYPLAVILRVKDLASQTAPEGLSKEKREKYRKGLLTRKRKAWSDLLKELKRGGDESWIRGQPLMPSSDIIATEKGEVYFDRLRGCLPVLRKALCDHHSDVNTRDLSRGICLTESGFALALETRSTYVSVLLFQALLCHALSNYATLQRQISRLRAITDSSVLARIESFDKVEQLRLALSLSTRALEELAEAIQEHTAVVEASHLLESLPTRIDEMTSSFPHLAHVLVPTAQWIRDQGTFSFPQISASHIEPTSDVDTLINTVLVAVQNMLKRVSDLSGPTTTVSSSEEPVDNYIRNGARTTSTFTLLLDLPSITERISHISEGLVLLPQGSIQAALKRILPFLHSFLHFSEELLESQARWTAELLKLDYVVCSVVHALATRGFCIPPETEEGDEATGNEGGKDLEGTGIGEGAGVENVSKEIEDESQVEGLQGEMEDVEEEEDGDGEEEPPEDGEGPDEQLGKLDRADPNKVDEKLWGDEPGEDEEDQQGDELPQDRSGQASDESNVVAKERESRKSDKKKEATKEETKNAGEECEEEGEEDVQEEERESPNAAGAPMDEHIPDANTLDLPEDMNLDNDKEGGQIEDEDTHMDADTGQPDIDASHEPSTADDETHSNGAPPHATDGPTDEMDIDGGDEKQGENAAAEPDLTHGDGDAGMTNRTSQLQDSTTDAQKEAAPLPAQEGIGGLPMYCASPPEPQASSEPAPTQVIPEAGSDSDGSRSGPAHVQRAPTSAPGPDPLRKLGDALKEIQQRFDEIFSAPEQTYPQEVGKSDDAEQVMYEHDENEDGMQALGQSTEEPVAKLKELTLVERNLEEHEVVAVDAPVSETVDARDVAMEHLHAEKMAHRTDVDLEGAMAHTEREKAMRGTSTQAPVDPSTRTTEDESEAELPSVTNEVVRATLESLTSSPDTVDASAYTQLWTLYTSLVMPLSIALCELRGDFRTGKRLNMRRVIAWVASEYTKDRIWLRRVKPSARAYQVLLAVDDSASMRGGGGGAVHLAYQTVVLVAQALGRLEAGEVGVARFGSGWELVRGFGEGARDWGSSPVLGGGVLSALTFRQQRTDVAGFLEGSLGVLEAAREAAGSRGATKDLWQLEIIISDGICQEHERLRRALRRARSMRVLVVFIVLDALNEGSSTLVPAASNTTPTASSATAVSYRQSSTTGQMELTMERYLDSFPFEYYVVLRDVEALPRVLADTLREFFEKVNEE